MTNDDHSLAIIKEVGSIHLEGNIIPHEWFKHLRYPDGKPNTIAAIILADIVYWYRPRVEKDERTGRILGYYKRFKADKLQKSYGALAEQFGFTKRQVRSAIDFLKEKRVITTELRIVPVPGGMPMSNVLFIEIVPDALRSICLPCDIQVTVYDPDVNPSDIQRTPYDTVSQTYTEITTETTTENKKEPAADAASPPPQKADGYRQQTTKADTATRSTDADNRDSRPASTKHLLPDDFALTDDLRAWGVQHTPGVDLERETAAFIDWAHANKPRKDDWIATWRNWMRKEYKHIQEQQRRTSRYQPPTPAARTPLSPEEERIKLYADRHGITLDQARRDLQAVPA